MGRMGLGTPAGVGVWACGVVLALLFTLAPLGCAHKSKKSRSLEGVPVVRVRVIEVNEKLKRISLSMKSGERGGGRGNANGASGGGRGGNGRGGNGNGRPATKAPERAFTLDDLKAKFNNK